MRYFQAQDTFVAGMPDGTEHLVTKGEARPETDELVKRDLAASKDNPGRAPLFRLLDPGTPEAAAKPGRAAARKAAGNG